MKTKKPNKQPEPRGRRQPPPQAGGWSGPRGLPDDVSRGPRLLAVGTFPGRGSGARTSPSRVTELSGERWPVLTLEARPPRRCSEARGEPAQPSPARVIGSNVAAGNKAGHTARRRAGCAGDGRSERDKQRGESSQAQALAGDQPGVAPCFGAAEPPPEKSLRVPADDRSDRWQSGVRRCRGISSLFDIELTALF